MESVQANTRSRVCRPAFLLMAATCLAGFGASWTFAAKTTPTRPAATAKAKDEVMFGGVDYVRLMSIAASFGATQTLDETHRASWSQAGRVLLDAPPGTREVRLNGLRVFLANPTIFSHGDLYISRVDIDRRLRPLLAPHQLATPPPRPKIIALDPGHGGSDSGTTNPRLRLLEKDLTLDVALRLKPLLESQGFTVVMTRTTDRALGPTKAEDLVGRAEIANRAHADLLVSIHFNALSDTKDQITRGAEVYTYPPAGQHSTEWWTQSKTKDLDLVTDAQPGNKWDTWNVVLAQALQRNLTQTLKAEDRGQKLMHLGVLRWANCPAALVEPAVLTNDAEARRLGAKEFRQEIAQALALGIREYADLVTALRPPR